MFIIAIHLYYILMDALYFQNNIIVILLIHCPVYIFDAK
jgi:hypothetical protein